MPGVCETVLEAAGRKRKPGALAVKLDGAGRTVAVDSDEEEAEWLGRERAASPDVAVQPAHRLRSNTAIQLQLHKEERRKAAQVKRLRWQAPEEASQEELAAAFPSRAPVRPNAQSRVSQLISAAPDAALANPYQEFARFQATVRLFMFLVDCLD